MNIGLLLLLGNLLFGGIDDDKADSVKPNNIPENSELQRDSNPDKEPVKSNTNPPDSTKKDNLDNKAPIITGSVDYIIKQDSYFAFTPKVEDPVNDKLSFSINNLPDWAVFNSNTGSITGEPSNSDVGITENITITVIDSQGNKASLLPFDIEVVNINDRPIIAGSPSLIVFPSESYKFKPDVIDNCIDSLAEELDLFIKFQYLGFYSPILYFIKGKLISGGLFENALDIRFENGKFVYPENFLEPFGENNEKLRYKSKDGDGGKPLTGSISKALSYAGEYNNLEIGLFKKGYYLEGMYVEDNKVVSEIDYLTWKLTDFEGNYYRSPLLLKQKNIYAFVNTTDGEGETAKLYKNGELFNGTYKNNNYTDGVEQ